jgi:predicted transcriptional regulator
MFKYEQTTLKILKILKESSPASTGFIAKKLNVSYATAQRALFELLEKSKVTHKKVSGRMLWWYKE